MVLSLMKNFATLTQSRLHELVAYNPETGVFTRKVTTSPRAIAGMVAGRHRADGYSKICVDGKEYYAHRLAWLYVHGVWPQADVDHIDGDPSNNRIDNLRSVTHAQNTLNSRQRPVGISGLRGVTLHRNTGLWNSRIRLNGRQVSLGYFQDAQEAHKAYLAAVEKQHGEFAFIKRPAQKSAHPQRFTLAGDAENG